MLKAPPMPIDRFPWDGFPAVWLHAEELEVKKHPDYAAAKAGNLESAFSLVEALASEEVIDHLAKVFCAHQPILTSAHAIERDGVNAIPEALADHLGHRLGWPVDSEIVQTNVVGHTGADGFTRMARQAEFGGEVKEGRIYCLVDDFVGQGGTLANMRGFFNERRWVGSGGYRLDREIVFSESDVERRTSATPS